MTAARLAGVLTAAVLLSAPLAPSATAAPAALVNQPAQPVQAAQVARPVRTAQPAAKPLAQTDRDTALRELHLDTGADYVVVVDSSGSMRGHHTQVQNALRALFKALGPTDRAALVSFRAAPSPAGVVVPLGRVGDPEALVDALPEEGGSTDISDGLGRGLKVLEDDPKIRPAAVVLVTDAGQTPGAASPAAWDALTRRVSRLRDRQGAAEVSEPVRAFVLDWGTTADAQEFAVGTNCRARSSYTVAQCVFSRADTGQVDPGRAAALLRQLPDEFADRSFEARTAPDAALAHAGSAVTATVGRPVAVTSDGAQVPVTFTSRTSAVPLRVQDVTVRVPGLSGVRTASVPPIDLAPGRSATTTLRLSWDGVGRPWYAAGRRPWHGTVTVGYALDSRYRALMSRAARPEDRFDPRAGHSAAAGLSVSGSGLWRAELVVLAVLALWLLILLAGFPTVLWLRGEGRAVPLLVWLPVARHRVRRGPYEGLAVSTWWQPWQRFGAEGPVAVDVWPKGRPRGAEGRRPHHRIALRRAGSPVPLPGFRGSTVERGGLLRTVLRRRTADPAPEPPRRYTRA